ncbi:hypothetical protein [Facklamia sp. P9177]|uniref:hypothetical protein n=1 Tax=Facklamia sp. P9177 TaxID=3421945 RepID=UPI003D17C98E
MYSTLISFREIRMRIAFLEFSNADQTEIDILKYSLKKLDDFINRQSEDIQVILKGRYYENRSFKDISLELGYSYNRVVKMHGTFIKALKIAESKHRKG